MTRLFASLSLCALLTSALPAAAAPATFSSQAAPKQGDQARARQDMLAGRNMPTDEIERQIIPQMGRAEYLGFEYDSGARVYRLKFIDNGRVIWVDVDARTAKVLRISR